MAVPRWKNIFDAATNNDLEGVQYFVDTDKIAVTTKNDDEETPAHIAAKVGNLEMLKYLLQKDGRLAAATDLNGNTVLDIAAEVGALSLVKYLLDNVNVDVHRSNSLRVGYTALHIAAEEGQLPVLKYLIEVKKLDPNLRNDMKQTAAFVAAGNNHLEVLRYLVEECKADVTITDFNDNNILYMCAPNGNVAVARYLLDERKIDLDIDYRDTFCETVLQRAARFNQVAFIKYLMEEKHANPNLQDLHGRCALHEAATKGHIEVIRYMVEHGADTNVLDLYNQNPLQVATDEDVIDYLNRTTPVMPRFRRSLLESWIVSRRLDSSALSLVSSPLHQQLSRIGEADEISGRRFGGANFVGFFRFLALVSGFAGLGARSGYDRTSLPTNERMSAETDPIAVDVLLNSTFDFE